jgi:predicted AAA+ superfamily ATPase
LVRDSIAWSASVGVVGLRQVGKTTLLQSLAKTTLSLDDPKVIQHLEDAPEQLLEQSPSPVLLDEVQKFPKVFDVLKLLIDRKKRPGRFLLTGSVRFNSKKGIQESLTGRLVTWEMLPLTLSETHQRPFGSIATLLSRGVDHTPSTSASQIERYIQNGGMPGICFLRNPAQRTNALQSLLDSFLNRDTKIVRPLQVRTSVIQSLFRMLCRDQGLPANHSNWAREVGVSVPTVLRIVDTFESLYLVRKHGKTYFVEDLGLASLYGTPARPVQCFVYSELKAQSLYRPELRIELTEYHTRGGAYLPFVLRSPTLGTIGISVQEEDFVSEKSLGSLDSFKKINPSAKLIVFHRGSEPSILGPNQVLALPWTWLS